MLLREAVPISRGHDRGGTARHAGGIGRAADLARAGRAAGRRCRSRTDGVTYAPKLTREAGRIDWARDAAAIERQVRAFNPWPGTFTTLHGRGAEGAGGPASVGVWAAWCGAGRSADYCVWCRGTSSDTSPVGRPPRHDSRCLPAGPSSSRGNDAGRMTTRTQDQELPHPSREAAGEEAADRPLTASRMGRGSVYPGFITQQ